ncbi:MAG: hypothetical protein ABL999_15695 [Pyrinomonadaceae bacterium]
MYCSVCGAQVDAALNYCNRCGNRVPRGESMSVAENLSQAVGYVGGFGLLGFIFVCIVLLRREIPMEVFVPIAAFYLIALVAICWMMLRYSSQLTKMKVEASRSGDNFSDPHYLNPRTTTQLDEPAQQPASVIEHTTRTLDKTAVNR